MNRSLLFVVEVVEDSGTVSVILVDFLLLTVLFWRQRRQVGIVLDLDQMLVSDGTVSSSTFIQSDNALTYMVLVLTSGSQTISCNETVWAVVSVISSPKMFSSSVFFHENIRDKRCTSVWCTHTGWVEKKRA